MERALLPKAKEIEGLDEEIALLRVKLYQVLSQHPEDTDSTRYRLSKKAKEDLYQNILGVLRGIGGTMFSEGFDV